MNTGLFAAGQHLQPAALDVHRDRLGGAGGQTANAVVASDDRPNRGYERIGSCSSDRRPDSDLIG